MELWINTAKECGGLVPKPKGERIVYA